MTSRNAKRLAWSHWSRKDLELPKEPSCCKIISFITVITCKVNTLLWCSYALINITDPVPLHLFEGWMEKQLLLHQRSKHQGLEHFVCSLELVSDVSPWLTPTCHWRGSILSAIYGKPQGFPPEGSWTYNFHHLVETATCLPIFMHLLQ